VADIGFSRMNRPYPIADRIPLHTRTAARFQSEPSSWRPNSKRFCERIFAAVMPIEWMGLSSTQGYGGGEDA